MFFLRCAVWWWCAVSVPFVYAQQESASLSSNTTEDASLVIKDVRGHHFNVPEDREITKKNGVYVLTPIDQYVAQKFQKMEERVAALEAQVAQLNAQISALQEKEGKDVSR